MAVFSKMPPEFRGDVAAYIKAVGEHLRYMQEQADYTVTQLEKRIKTLEEKGEHSNGL